MSRQLCELCTLLVDEFVGSLASTIFSVLVARGRLSLPQIIFHSQINPRHVKNALVILLQRQLVTYACTANDDRTYYEANISHAYRLIRAGKQASLADVSHGKDAAFLTQQVQERGFIAANEIDESFHHSRHAANDKIMPDADLASNLDYMESLESLFRSKHFVRARRRDLISQSALVAELEVEIARRKFPAGVVGTSAREELQDLVKNGLKHARDDNQASVTLFKHGLKRANPSQVSFVEAATHNHAHNSTNVNGNLPENNINGYSHSQTSAKENIELEDRKTSTAETDDEHPRRAKRRKVDLTTSNDPPIHSTSKKSRNKAVLQHIDNSVLQVTNSSLGKSKSRNLNLGQDSEEITNSSGQTEVPSHPNEQNLVNGQSIGNTIDTQSETNISQLNNTTNSQSHQENLDTFSHEPFFRLNLEKFDVSLRNQLLVDFCLNCLGEPSSKVYAALLHCAAASVKRCHDDLEDDGNPKKKYPSMTENDEGEGNYKDDAGSDQSKGVFAAVIASTLDPKAELYADDVRSKEKPHQAAAAESSADGATEYPRPSLREAEVEYHLRILAGHEHGFAYATNLHGRERWHVDFRRLTALMIQRELQTLIASRFDSDSARITRILQAKGKMEEKFLANISLIKQKDIRAKLAAMQEAGFLEVQEVPRDAARQPSRTIYLWFFDPESCRGMILNDTYQTMARLLQRLRFERTKARTVLDKASRTDVVGREDELLNEAEKAALRELERKEDKLWVQVSRLDDTVALLRDFL